jgi:hypothetical protein
MLKKPEEPSSGFSFLRRATPDCCTAASIFSSLLGFVPVGKAGGKTNSYPRHKKKAAGSG